ncbi:unnamed protein product, partial [Musa textilis]
RRQHISTFLLLGSNLRGRDGCSGCHVGHPNYPPSTCFDWRTEHLREETMVMLPKYYTDLGFSITMNNQSEFKHQHGEWSKPSFILIS